MENIKIKSISYIHGYLMANLTSATISTVCTPILLYIFSVLGISTNLQAYKMGPFQIGNLFLILLNTLLVFCFIQMLTEIW